MSLRFVGGGNTFTTDNPGATIFNAFQQSRLAKLYGDYYKTGQADLGQLGRLDPEGAAKIKAEQEQSAIYKLLGDAYNAPDDQRQGYLSQVMAKDPNLGLQFAKALDPRMQQGAETPADVRSFDYFTNGLTDEQRQRAVMEKLGIGAPKPGNAQFVDVPDGLGGMVKMIFDPQTRQLSQPQYPGSQATAGLDQPNYGAAAFGSPDDFYAAVGGVIAPHNGRITSTNGGQHNVGSLHGSGGAVDVGMGRETPQQQAAIIAALQNDPRFTVRDERQRPAGQAVWSGPHLHVERAGNGGKGAQRFGYTPPKSEASGYRTMTAAEVAKMGLPVGTVAQMSPTGQVQIVNKPRDLPAGGQVIENDDGTTTFIPAGKVSEGERNAAGFFQRMVEANAEMKRLEDAGYDPSNRRDYYTAGGEFLNPLASNEGQQYRQAQNNWLRANLRKESGAAIGVEEMDQERKNYFPIPGDTADTVAQKARNRQTTERAMRQAAGGAMPPPSGQKAGNKSPRTITTQAEYDALPSGAVFIEDGKQYRKP